MINKADKYYIDNLKQILLEDNKDENPRPVWSDGTPAHSYFITHVFEKYDISKGEFPIPTLRNTAVKTGLREILWIYQKQTNCLKTARDMNINWWDNWNIGNDTIGVRYGATIANYNLMDKLLTGLMEDPFSRRHIISLWQEEDFEIDVKGLKPCAFMTQWSIKLNKDGDYVIDMILTQRSSDFVMAGGINKMQYVGLMMMVVGHLNHHSKLNNNINKYKIGTFSHIVTNLHVYDRHLPAVYELLERKPVEDFKFNMCLSKDKDFYDYTIDDFIIEQSHKINKISSDLPIAI